MSHDVIVGGAGMSGLIAAQVLQRQGYRVKVLEAGRSAGGRVASAHKAGFILDRGFQVLLTRYPMVRRYLDLEALNLRLFPRGATTRYQDEFVHVADPRTNLADSLSGAATLLRAADLPPIWRLCSLALKPALSPDCTTSDYLANAGFSPPFRTAFLEPFLRGVLLDPHLLAPADVLAFYMRMFATGNIALPAQGMSRVAEQLVAQLDPGTVCVNQRIAAIGPGHVVLSDGKKAPCRAFVSALDATAAGRLAVLDVPGDFHQTVCHYFGAPADGLSRTLPLVLNGSGHGALNHVAIPSLVSAEYAPPGQHLVSATEVGTAEPAALSAVKSELRDWFGSAVDNWTHLESTHVPNALPAQGDQPKWNVFSGELAAAMTDQFGGPCAVAGDFSTTASLNGAMESGERAAQHISRALGSSQQGAKAG
jgi:phytoene dehydrogenase-like protein